MKVSAELYRQKCTKQRTSRQMKGASCGATSKSRISADSIIYPKHNTDDQHTTVLVHLRIWPCIK